MQATTLIQKYLLGIATEDEVRDLEASLTSSEDLRREFVLASQLDTVGRDVAIEKSMRAGELSIGPIRPDNHLQRHRDLHSHGWKSLGLISAIAAAVLLAVSIWPRTPPGIATIVSSENAAWESSLPTRAGDQLMQGRMNLRTGIATIRFTSGAELLLEAPATLELISAMRCRLESGAGVVNVPDSAIGFVVETPGGYTEDFGTRFTVRVDEDQKQSDLQLLEGEIEVHHTQSGESLRLSDAGAAVLVSEQSIRLLQETDADEREPVIKPQNLFIGTNGRCGTAMKRFEKRKKFIDPAVLSVKHTDSGKWDYQSFFSFDLTGVDFDRVTNAKLWLNLVPSSRGLASRLPKLNRFGIYGLTNPAKSNWAIKSRWEDAPGPDDGELLGTFQLQRSQTRGLFGIEGEALLDFVKKHPEQVVTLILVRETSQIEGTGTGLTHMFASDSHPESVGPQLELISQ